MRRITQSTSVVLALLAALVLAAVGCSDDDDDLLEDPVREETEQEDSTDDDSNEGPEDENEGDSLNTTPSTGAEYLQAQTQIASDLADEFGQECGEAVDLGDLSFSDGDPPEECRDYFGEFADRLEEVEPPDACASLHQLLLEALSGLAEGEDDVLDDLLEGEDGQPSEGIVEASVDCSGI